MAISTKKHHTATIDGTTYRAAILPDPEPMNPRTEYDNVGVMTCWHSRYNLGDKHEHKGVDDWLGSLLVDVQDVERLSEALESITQADADLKREWEQLEAGVVEQSGLTGELPAEVYRDFLIELCANGLSKAGREAVRDLAEHYHVIVPLYLYDHSGITMSTGKFSCPWDSGQVGYIHVSYERAREEYGELPQADTPEERAKIAEYLDGEVKDYDDFLTGNLYGYSIEKAEGCEHCGNVEWEHVDSCYGFHGYDVEKNGMLEHVDDQFADLLKKAPIIY